MILPGGITPPWAGVSRFQCWDRGFGNRLSQGVAAGLMSGCTFGAKAAEAMKQESPNQRCTQQPPRRLVDRLLDLEHHRCRLCRFSGLGLSSVVRPRVRFDPVKPLPAGNRIEDRDIRLD